MQNNELMKYTGIITLLLGLALGLVAAIPFIGFLGFFAVLFLAAPAVLVYLIMAGLFDFTTIKNCVVVSSAIGFVANFSFGISYSFFTFILFKLFKYSNNIFLSSMIVNSPLWLLLVVIIFLGVLSATLNAFSGVATYYTINFIRDYYAKKHQLNSNDSDLF